MADERGNSDRTKRVYSVVMDPERRKELQDLIWGAGRWVIYGLLAMIMVWLAGSVLFGLGERKPEKIEDILKRAASKDPGSYVMEYQALRRVTYEEDQLQNGVHATVQMDRSAKSFVLNIAGVTTDGEPMHVQHAGGVTIYTTPSFGPDWYEAPSLSPTTVGAFTPETMKSMKPKLLRDTGSYRSLQSWVIELKPSGKQLADLLWANELQMTGSTAEKERKQLEDGKYKLDYARAWIGYGTEQLFAIDLQFQIEKGARYRIRVKYGSWGSVDLKKLKLRQRDTDGLVNVTPEVGDGAADSQPETGQGQ